MIDYLCQAMLHRRRDYAVYVPTMFGSPSAERRKQIDAMLTPGKSGHAGETETSEMLAMFPELVDGDAVGGRTAEPTGRLSHLPPGNVVGAWYSAYPDHYCGDATLASIACLELIGQMEQVGAPRRLCVVIPAGPTGHALRAMGK